MKALSRIIVVIALLAVLAVSVSAQDDVDRTDWPTTFILGLFGGDDSAETLRDNEPLRAYLTEALGIEVLITTGTSYSAVIEAMRADRVDAMLVGPFAFVLAEQEADAEPIAVLALEGAVEGLTELPSETPPPFYYSVFVTKKGSGIDSLDDLEGQDMAFVDPASTSGRNAPVVRLINEIEGLETPADVDAWLNPIFAGSHPSAITALIEDQVAAAVTFEGNLINIRNEGLAEICGFEEDRVGVTLSQEEIDAIYADCPEGSLVVFAQTAPIPNTPMAIRSELPESFKLAVQEALLNISADLETLQSIGYYFVDPTTIEALELETIGDFYDVVRDLAEITAAN
ncbi:MAG: phosphate/phosphite/phosphonate ABC transporter substrate-binding protein [Anaerolineae bacterium]